jgi:LysR family hca operon transcriptional activator
MQFYAGGQPLPCHQPALSRQIRDVEEALEIKLFERQSRCVQITEAGKLFVREAKRTLEQSYRTTSLVQAFARQQKQPMAVGLSLLADIPGFHRCLDRVRKSVPENHITVHAAYTPEMIAALARAI